jgi:isopropylmalate/homocitrate/citramalate synthase
MSVPKTVRIVEVGPRDGLQNEAVLVPHAVRLHLIQLLIAAGLKNIEVGSFVSPRWVPQMAGTADLLTALPRDNGVHYPVLVPNAQGLAAALAVDAKEIAVFVAASESFSKKNINCTIDESFQRLVPVAATARKLGIRVRGYISCVVGCPYEGAIAPTAVASVAARLLEMGCYEISLGDTIGVGTPGKVQAMIDSVATVVPIAQMALHFHDTWGQALANIFAGLERGVAVIDSAVAGLGGCPYAKGASGNVATEDVVYLLNGLGIDHGVNLGAVAQAGRYIMGELGRSSQSKVAQALLAADRA